MCIYIAPRIVSGCTKIHKCSRCRRPKYQIMKYAKRDSVNNCFQWAGSSLLPLKQSTELLLQSVDRFTPGIVSRGLFCKHEPDYIGGAILVIHSESIQCR